MKIIVAGSTGFLATEIIRQALSLPVITAVVALGRREISTPTGLGPEADPSKLKTVVLKDFQHYTDDVKRELEGADAVIWTIAISPSKLKTVTWEQTCAISRDYAVTGIKTITPLPRGDSTAGPLRFIYMSGSNAERNQSKKPLLLGDYCLMRGDAENRILEYAQNSGGAVQACVAKSGIIEDPNKIGALEKIGRVVLRSIVGLPKVNVDVAAAALLNQTVSGFEKDTLLNEDLVRIGTAALTANVRS